MATKNEVIKKQLTEKGLEDYKTLIKTLVRIYNNEEKNWKYKTEQAFLGFGKYSFEDKEQVLEWVKCLVFLVGGQLSRSILTEKDINNQETKKTYLEYTTGE